MTDYPVWLYLVIATVLVYGVLVSASILSSCRANQRATAEAQEALAQKRVRVEE